MGRKQTAADKKPEEPKEEEKKEEPKKEDEPKEPDDPPIVKALKEVDDKYLALEREYELEVDKLRKAFEAKQQPFLDERKKLLLESDKENKSSGTPALPGFWLQALKNHPAFDDEIQKWDEPVLEFLIDVTKAYVDQDDSHKGFIITMSFLENDYFTNTELTKEIRTKEPSPYTGDIDCIECKSTVIDWKQNKDVTVERVEKKVKGGGAKKAKQKGKATIEPRDSFFRSFFVTHKEGEPLSDEVKERMLEGMPMDDDDDDDDDEMIKYFLESQLEVGEALRDQIIPFAVRWFTGEADPNKDDDDDDEDEEEEEDDDDDDDDDEESDEDDEPAPKSKGKPKKSPKTSPSVKPAKDPKAEECKQQ
jgi:nucleosome assembly protein 1-like 1